MQTEQSAHEAWAQLCISKPKAAALLHVIVARMDRSSNALVISHENLAVLLGGVSTRTVKNHLTTLTKDRWIQIVSLGRGAMNAYLVNSTVAWGLAREQIRFAQFTAQVVAADIDQSAISSENLRKIPVVFSGEQQLPNGIDSESPSQRTLDGISPDLPAIEGDAHLQVEFKI